MHYRYVNYISKRFLDASLLFFIVHVVSRSGDLVMYDFARKWEVWPDSRQLFVPLATRVSFFNQKHTHARGPHYNTPSSHHASQPTWWYVILSSIENGVQVYHVAVVGALAWRQKMATTVLPRQTASITYSRGSQGLRQWGSSLHLLLITINLPLPSPLLPH